MVEIVLVVRELVGVVVVPLVLWKLESIVKEVVVVVVEVKVVIVAVVVVEVAVI